MNVTLKSMEFAFKVHAGQKRKYTGNPYTDHLAEVVGIVASVLINPVDSIDAAWLHDCVEDCGVSLSLLRDMYGEHVSRGVWFLTNVNHSYGNRKARCALDRDRLSNAPGWVQNIKVADLISNTSSIVMYDPEFAVTYLEEKRLLLDVLTQAHPMLLKIARSIDGVSSCQNLH